jgi:beta-glucuronidase
MPNRAWSVTLVVCLAVPLISAACSLVPGGSGANLPTTLSFKNVSGGPVAFQSDQPVPTFDWQPRSRVDLNGAWRFQSQTFDSDVSLTDRKIALDQLSAELGGRANLDYEDSFWSEVQVPGTFDPPPHREMTGGYFRKDFVLPENWSAPFAMLKFGAVRYVADVWLNGHYIGYHEGGDTSFALDVTQALNLDGPNALLVRVDNPTWGTRDDIVPWGLVDWWNYGGIVGDVWMEGMPSLSAVRADISPHLDSADVSIVVQHRGAESVSAAIDVRLWPAQVNADNLLNPDAFSLVPPSAQPMLDRYIDLGTVSGDTVQRLAAPFSIRSADLWSPALPALFVLGVTVIADGKPVDDIYTSFGLRQVKVDSTAPRILLNGQPVVFNGVALHEDLIQPTQEGRPKGGPTTAPSEIYELLSRALRLHASLIRVDHHPPNQMLTLLADRLGLAVWEEIPLYHFTGQTFTIAMNRGIPQQMLAEMDLRDFNRPSVLFHGFANESAGRSERSHALNTLHNLDRRIDGTRLTGQAASGLEPADPTSAKLDVAGYTFYHGVLYGGKLSGVAIQKALSEAHHTYPRKPVMILEYGRWSDNPAEDPVQLRVFNTYYSQLSSAFASEPGGFVSAAVWWSLDDYWTQRAGLSVENFGLYRPDGSLRPAGIAAARNFALTAPPPSPRNVTSGGVAVPIQSGPRHNFLWAYIGYGLAVPVIVLALAIVLLTGVRRRAW